MNKRKAMSQTLTLIVAASVLMMTALTVIFMSQGSLQDVFADSNRQSCTSTVESKCGVTDGTISLPSSCERAGMTDGTISGYEVVDGEEVQCGAGDGGDDGGPFETPG